MSEATAAAAGQQKKQLCIIKEVVCKNAFFSLINSLGRYTD
jgi:hypothetical protein